LGKKTDQNKTWFVRKISINDMIGSKKKF